MPQFERHIASLGQQHGQPPTPLPLANNVPYSRVDRNATHAYEDAIYIFDDEQPRHGQFDDNILSMYLRAHGPTFTTETTFSEFRMEYINCLQAIHRVFH
jgi:hypothetical protein